MELKIDRGLKSYDIEDADGTPLGAIYVNPADLGIAARLDEARKAVQALADGLGDDVDAEKIGDVDRQIKEQVNYIFGSDASAVFFKGTSALALCDDGALLLEKVFSAFAPIIEDAVGDAMKASRKRMESTQPLMPPLTRAWPPASRRERLGSAHHRAGRRAGICNTLGFPRGAGCFGGPG